MRIVDCIQGEALWFETRAGLPTASNFDKLLTMDGKPSKQQEKYLYQLAGEKVSGQKEETYQSAAMLRGIEMEEEAVKLYEFQNDVVAEKVGFCITDDGIAGCSPDRLIGEDGLLEIKCPLIYTHVSYLINGGLDTDYYQQCQGQLFVTGRKWLHLMSYYPGLKPLIIRVQPHPEFQITLELELKLFNKKLQDIIGRIK